jgi:hypothetical protein
MLGGEISLVRGKDQWRHILDMVINLHVLWKVENTLII